MNLKKRALLIPAAGAVLATSGFAFMASNSVETSYAGTGQGSVVGYDISSVHYNGSNGALDFVNFYATPQNHSTDSATIPGSAQIKFDNTGWLTCSRNDADPANYQNTANGKQTSWRCDVRGLGIAPSSDHLQVMVLR